MTQSNNGNISPLLHQCMPEKMASWLALAEFWYNISPHSATGFSPFEALYGHSPRHSGISVLDAMEVP